MKNKKGFTLVELIVVITILAILGTIAFISLQNYSKDARDSKRLQDVRSLLTKLNVENVKGTPYDDMLTGTTVYDKKINGSDKPVTNGIINFELLRESQSNFRDPSSMGDYDFVNATGESNGESYNFIEGRYYSEKTNKEVIMGNYYQFLSSDSIHLFSGTLIGPNLPSLSCDDTTKPTDNGHIEYNPGNPSVQDTPWTQSASGDCTYKCKKGFTGVGCDTLLVGVIEDGDDLIVNDGTNTITISNKNIGALDVGTGSTSYGYYFQWGRNDTGWTSGSSGTKYDWQVPQVNDAWGGLNDTATTTAPYTSARQGPCPNEYHVPSTEEWARLIKIWFKTKQKECDVIVGSNCSWIGDASFDNFQSELKIPQAGLRHRNGGGTIEEDTNAYYWPSSYSGNYAYYMYFDSDAIRPQYYTHRAYGFPIRCFKN